MNLQPTAIISPAIAYTLLGCALWACGWLAMFLLDGYFDLGNLGMLLVLTSALATVCLPLRISLVCGVISVLVFNWAFIPPRGTFMVNLHQHALMLLVMFVVNIIIAILIAMLRTQSARAMHQASEVELLRSWSNQLHESSVPADHLEQLQHLLIEITHKPVALLVLKNDLPAQDNVDAAWYFGEIGIEQRHALWYSTRHCQQLGRGTGRFDIFSDVYLPLRARGHALGAALIGNFAVHDFSTRVHLQAICDQMGSALDRHRLHQQEILAREKAQAQRVRNNLLAAISHDYRTPLATIMGAASSLGAQADKLEPSQQQQLTQRIIVEAERLTALTTNILLLARLDAGNPVACDWQSAEEIVGDVLRRWRERPGGHRLHIQLQPDLPLLWCDAVLIGQVLENLIDNALKYSAAHLPVNMQVSVTGHYFLFEVSDSGPGIDAFWREKIFEPFQRGPLTDQTPAHQNLVHQVAANGQVTGTGVGLGLTLCRAIVSAHAGELRVESPAVGGSCFECYLPLRLAPTAPGNVVAGAGDLL